MAPFKTQKRERQYVALKDKFQKSGRYGKRAKEVAARIVNKQRSQYAETEEKKQQTRRKQNPDRGLPIQNYQHLTIAQVRRHLDELDRPQLQQIHRYEQQHKQRKTLLAELDRRL